MNPDWKYVTLEDAVTKRSSNISLNKIKDEQGDYPVYGAKGFVKNVSFFQQEEDYLAIIKDGAGIGRVSKHPANSSVLATMQYLLPKDGFDIGFIEYFLNSIDFQKYKNGSTIPHIYFKDYKNELIPMLPPEEQKRIVAILDEAFAGIDTAIANTERNLANARELFESYLIETFNRETQGATKTTLSKLCEPQVITYGVIKLGEHIADGVPCLRTSNVRRLWIDTEGMKLIAPSLSEQYERTILKGGEVLVNVRGTLGGVAVAGSEMKGWNVSREVAVVPVDNAKIDPYYAAYWIATKKSQDWLTGVIKGVAYKGINLTDLRELPVYLPDLDKQKKIISDLDDMVLTTRNLVDIYNRKLIALGELRQSLLQKAFSGELTMDDNKLKDEEVA